MRKFLLQNAFVFQSLYQIDRKQLLSDEKFERIFKALETRQPQPDKDIFFDGQIFDAYIFVADIIKKADNNIILIDNYDEQTRIATILSDMDAGTQALETKMEKYRKKTEDDAEFINRKNQVGMNIDKNELQHFNNFVVFQTADGKVNIDVYFKDESL